MNIYSKLLALSDSELRIIRTSVSVAVEAVEFDEDLRTKAIQFGDYVDAVCEALDFEPESLTVPRRHLRPRFGDLESEGGESRWLPSGSTAPAVLKNGDRLVVKYDFDGVRLPDSPTSAPGFYFLHGIDLWKAMRIHLDRGGATWPVTAIPATSDVGRHIRAGMNASIKPAECVYWVKETRESTDFIFGLETLSKK